MFKKLKNILSGGGDKKEQDPYSSPNRPQTPFQKPVNAFAEPQAQKSLGLDSTSSLGLDLPRGSTASSRNSKDGPKKSSSWFKSSKKSKKHGRSSSGASDMMPHHTTSTELPSPLISQELPPAPRPKLVEDPTDAKVIHEIPLQKKEEVVEDGPPMSPWDVDTPPTNEVPKRISSATTDEEPTAAPGNFASQSSEAFMRSGPEMIPFPPHLGRAFVIGIRNQKPQEFSAEAEEKVASEMSKEVDVADDRVALKDVHLLTEENEPIVLGEGGFGKVYKGSLYKEICAVKTVNQGTRKEQARFLNEIRILGRLKTKHITRFMGFAVLPDGLCLIMEYVPGGTLFKSLQTSDRHRYWNKGRDVLISVAIALNVLHAKRICHLDLKSPNVLIDEQGEAKVADVGLSKLMKGEMSLVSMPGSWPWSAPEQLHGQAGIPCDIWSFGTLAFEVCTGEKPPMNRFLRKITVPDEAPQQMVDIIKKCHNPDPTARITADQLYHLLEQCPTTKSG